MPKLRSANSALALVSILLLINFWAWSVISPLANNYAAIFNLTPVLVSLLLATPVIVGSLGRIPIGLLSDRFGGRKAFSVISFTTALALIGMAIANSYPQLVSIAFILGIAGASFAAGITFVNGWFSQNKGLAFGIYSMGNAGTAMAGLITPRIVQILDLQQSYFVLAAIVAIGGMAMLLLGQEGPHWKPNPAPAFNRIAMALKWADTWKLSALYAITFGAFVAFGLYLPILLVTVYELDIVDAAARAGGFVLLATLVRPLGGWLSDRWSASVILRFVFGSISLLVFGITVISNLWPWGTIFYLAIAALLGMGSGAVFSRLGQITPSPMIGMVTGIVGAIGGLGGFFPPFVLGVSQEIFQSFAPAFMLLAIMCLFYFLLIGKLVKGTKAGIPSKNE